MGSPGEYRRAERMMLLHLDSAESAPAEPTIIRWFVALVRATFIRFGSEIKELLDVTVVERMTTLRSFP